MLFHNFLFCIVPIHYLNLYIPHIYHLLLVFLFEYHFFLHHKCIEMQFDFLYSEEHIKHILRISIKNRIDIWSKILRNIIRRRNISCKLWRTIINNCWIYCNWCSLRRLIFALIVSHFIFNLLFLFNFLFYYSWIWDWANPHIWFFIF